MSNISKESVIKALVLDIDGVLTDGTVEAEGPSRRRVFLRDLDALSLARNKGVRLAFMTGENEAEAGPVIERCGGADQVIYKAKAKDSGLQEIVKRLNVGLSELCYLADARRDVPALKLVGLALCPADGDRLAKQAAHVVLQACGGHGAVAEAVDLILERNEIADD